MSTHNLCVNPGSVTMDPTLCNEAVVRAVTPCHGNSLINAIIGVVSPGAVATSPLVNEDWYNVRPFIITVYCSTAVPLGGEPISHENGPRVSYELVEIPLKCSKYKRLSSTGSAAVRVRK